MNYKIYPLDHSETVIRIIDERRTLPLLQSNTLIETNYGSVGRSNINLYETLDQCSFSNLVLIMFVFFVFIINFIYNLVLMLMYL